MSDPTPENANSTTVPFLIPASGTQRSSDGQHLTQLSLPRVLGGNMRAADAARDPFVNARVISVEAVFDLAGGGRSAAGDSLAESIANNRVLTLEASDGTTLIIRADKLQADLLRLYPDTALRDGKIDLGVLRDQEAAARGLSNWIWSKLSVLQLAPDGLVETAKDKALELLKDKLGSEIEDLAYASASWAGAKALMWAIESKLVGQPGLYHWQNDQLQTSDRVNADNPQLLAAAKNQQAILVFIHGTASSTTGSYGALRSGDDEAHWENLTRPFAGHVYGFEHRTFSESPLDNALQLARTLPAGARISLVTHSRGGLVGDLLCLGEIDDLLIQRYQRLPVEKDDAPESDKNRQLRERVVAEEQEQLRTLRAILKEKNFRIERYMRVACPASGTTLLSDNLDLFLSSLLSLLNFTVGLLPVVGTVGSTVLSAFRRIVLEIAEKRIDPRLIPGIEAMLPEAPLGALLAQAPRCAGVQMAVIAGDADGDSGGFLKRIAIMFTDWIVFDQFDNDFVVDTQSMRAGLARRNPTREFYARGHEVSHIHYFRRLDTRRALYQWLTSQEPEKLPAFNPIPTDCDIKLDALEVTLASTRSAHPPPANAPIVFYLPGVMGTHLEIRKPNQGRSEGDRVWFDPFHLAAGGIDQIGIDKKNVLPEGLFQRYYGQLANYLAQDHSLQVFDYDWRQSIAVTAGLFADQVRALLQELADQPHRPVSILAHSMGGLVVRAMIVQEPELWANIAQRPGSYFVMLGTPNQGSHAMVETLMGKASSVRKLAMIDFHHDLQEILDVIDDFDGVLQLLPPDAATDTGVIDAQTDAQTGEPTQHQIFDYFNLNQWKQIRKLNKDRWFRFSEGLGALPDKNRLKAAKAFWDSLQQQVIDGIPYADKISYVHGLDGHTPSGLTHKGEQLYLHGTVQGDGTVSWASGKLAGLADKQYWYMPACHSELTNTPAFFPALVELLRSGKTSLLEQKAPRTRSAALRSYRYDAGPALQPGAEDLAMSFFGGHPQRQPEVDDTQVLQVSVRAMDLRFAQHPLLCGHYQADSIAGAEYQIDQHLLNGALSQRERLGIYAGAVGTSTIVLNPRSNEDILRGSGRGAIIVGLGEWSQVTTQVITETVRDGVLQYLLHTRERPDNASDDAEREEKLNLNSLLIGYNSTTHITVEASIEAIVRGVCEANQQYRYNKVKGQSLRSIGKLEFVEFYLDTAITAAYTVRDLPQRLDKELQRLQARLLPAPELLFKQGMRQRLSERSQTGGYWPRLMVTDADRGDEQCPAECYQDKVVSPIPKPVLDAWKKQMGISEEPTSNTLHAGPALAERLKYVYLSERARAEAIIQQRQPGLIEALIKDAIRSSEYNRDISRTLFQLMVPLDFKSAARQTERMLLVLDGYTANLPWEMLQADGEPLALKMAMVRQLVSTRFRKKVATTLSKTACVIGNPSTAGFYEHFTLQPGAELRPDKGLVSLTGAVDEAQQVTKTLRNSGYTVSDLYPANPEDAPYHTAIDVFNILFKQAYRILMIAAHGEANIRGRDGKERTGVVLADGVMLTAAEVGQMEEVPDLVFLNCCHLAKTDNTAHSGFNRLAYSLSRELIEMGVRCVVAAGWAVDDAAACTFSTTFFARFVGNGQPFGKAVWEARKRTWERHPGLNTWGAYQAYGDPNYVLRADEDTDHAQNSWSPVAPQELRDRLESLSVDIQYKTSHYTFSTLLPVVENLLGQVPASWVREPGVQYILARLYGDMLPDGFEHARTACQIAIAEEDRSGNVPICALELLGNLEARQAEMLAEQASGLRIERNKLGDDLTDESMAVDAENLEEQITQLCQRSRELAKTAIQRLEGLLAITEQLHLAKHGGNNEEEGCTTNTERYALLGSAYKRQAVALMHCGAGYREIEGVLKQAHAAYKKGEGLSFDYSFKPYAIINRLQLEGILHNADENSLQLAEKAQIAARQSFAESYDFFDAVMVADAAVAIFLLTDHHGVIPSAESLLEVYHTAIRDVPHNARHFNSVSKQLDYLACFLEKCPSPGANNEATGDPGSHLGNSDNLEKARVLRAVEERLKQL